MTLARIPLKLIDNGERLRSLSEVKVEQLMSSIGDVGLLQPITVRPRVIYREGIRQDGYLLVAGLHRKVASERLDMEDIDATIVDLNDLESQIAECDENLMGAQLTQAERARFTARRKEAYELLHPETKAGIAGAVGKHGAVANLATAQTADKVDRFTADTAKATGQSERKVQRDAERGSKLSDDALDLLKGTDLDTGQYLDDLKAIPKAKQAAKVREDLKAATPKPKKAAKGKVTKGVKPGEQQRQVSINVEPAVWESFRAKAEGDGISAAAALGDLVKAKMLPRAPDADLDGLSAADLIEQLNALIDKRSGRANRGGGNYALTDEQRTFLSAVSNRLREYAGL